MKNDIPLQVDNRKRMPKKTCGKKTCCLRTQWVFCSYDHCL